MADVFYLILEGIQGDSQQAQLENSIECNALYHEIAQQSSGTSTGGSTGDKVGHGAISIVKRIDRASVKLIEACNVGQTIPSGRIEMRRSGGDGNQFKHYEISLQAVRVAGVRTEQLNNLFPESSNTPVIERVTLAYQRIEWKHFRQAQDGTLVESGNTNFNLATNTKD